MLNWKKVIAWSLCTSMMIGLAGCTKEKPIKNTQIAENDTADEEIESEDSLENVHIFMFKSSGNHFGDLMYEGFSEYLHQKGEKTACLSPNEATVDAQVRLLDDLLSQDVASITISANGKEGYEEVLEKAQEIGIPIFSVDSEINPEYRVCHVDQVDLSDIGSYLIQAAVLITLGLDYPENQLMESVLESELEQYQGEEIQLGVLSSSVQVPAQNGWISAMEIELSKDMYKGKVSSELDKKYGNDDPSESAAQAEAFVQEQKVDCIIAPTTIGIASAAQVLTETGSQIRLTGLGLPSEMYTFMPLSSEEDAFSYVCPYMMLWDVIHLGATAGAAVYATIHEGFSGESGSSFAMDAFREYETTTYVSYTSGDGTSILAGVPFVFYKGNMAEWQEVL